MSEHERRIWTDPWTGVTYEQKAGETPPPRARLTAACLRNLNLYASFDDQKKPDSLARQHIDDCPHCQQYMERKEWERKKEEELLSSPEVEALVAEYAKRFRVPVWQRRKFLAAASVLALGALGLGAKAWFGRGGPRPVGNGGSPTPNLDRTRTLERIQLDRAFQEGGPQAIGKILSDGRELEILVALDWIRDRQVSVMIPNVVGALSDSRVEVRRKATLTLLRLPPLAIKPFQSSLDAAAANESVPSIAAGMQKLAMKVAQAR